MKKIAFITSTASPEISLDDMALVEALEVSGIKCIAAPWDEPAMDWKMFDLLLIRSCWNYHLFPEKFATWITAIRRGKIKIANDAELVLWNMNKQYLKELQQKDVALPGTAWILENDFYADKLLDVLTERNWSRAVLKPCISASSFRTSIITASSAREEGVALSKKFMEGGAMLQMFVDEIQSHGELSLIFLNKEFSHAVMKQVKPGEFRVQHEFGGESKPVDVKKEIVKAGEKILSLLPNIPLYARVDGVVINNIFHLMELELIEPVLFLKQHGEAAKKLAFEIRKLI